MALHCVIHSGTGTFLCHPLKTNLVTQSPKASWSAGGRQDELWGARIFTSEILRLPVLSFVAVNSRRPPADQVA